MTDGKNLIMIGSLHWFVDSNTDDVPDSIVFDPDGDGSVPNWAPHWKP